MRRTTIVVILMTILGACGSPNTTNETSQGSAAATTTAAAGKPSGSGSTAKGERSDACLAMDAFILDLLVAGKARTQTPAKKQEVLTRTTSHAKALKAVAPELGLAVDVRLAYAEAVLAGEPTAEAKSRELTAQAQFDDWARTHGCS